MLSAVLRTVAAILASTLGIGALVAFALIWLAALALHGGVDEQRHWWE